MAGMTWDQVQKIYAMYWGAGGLDLSNPQAAAGAKWWIGRPIEQLTTALGKAQKPAPAAPQVETDPIVRAQTMGPTQYTPQIRANLDLDTPRGGPMQTSGMTNSVPSFTGYKPVAAKADPLVQLLAPYVAPVAPAPSPAPAAAAPAPKAPANPNTALQKGSAWQWAGGRNSR